MPAMRQNQAFQSAQVSLSDAIAAAERRLEERRWMRSSRGENEGATYEVEILKSDGARSMPWWSPSDGSVQVSAQADDNDEPNGDMDEGDGDGETDDD